MSESSVSCAGKSRGGKYLPKNLKSINLGLPDCTMLWVAVHYDRGDNKQTSYIFFLVSLLRRDQAAN